MHCNKKLTKEKPEFNQTFLVQIKLQGLSTAVNAFKNNSLVCCQPDGVLQLFFIRCALSPMPRQNVN